ncbi:MAG: lamin tail domain-containing protein [Verrucomicrobia bacterium]|nr:lamin tail domain-containing protein [Verrucomicrobiota bacterium]MBI3869412.1 lamin tail domain-containing protein [Verrucomicrobiota bacterium]
MPMSLCVLPSRRPDPAPDAPGRSLSWSSPWSLCVAAFLALGLSASGADHFILSEFLASNSSSLLDGNGNASDWIEIYNAGDAPGDLGGWHLTDDPLDPGKWTFPQRAMAAGEFLIVFASGSGTPDPAGHLHVNFQLTGAGEYLALTRPDKTVATEFAPAFPTQRPDVSYGISQQSFNTGLVTNGVRARLLIPDATSEAQAGALWMGAHEPFNDSAWLAVTNPIGYDAPSATAASLINVALHKPVTTLDEAAPAFPKENLTDGNLATFASDNTPSPDFSFVVDLGGAFKLENIEVFNRADACCPDRLTDYTVSLHADVGGAIGPAVWSANVRTNGSNSGKGGRDLLTPNLDANGVFSGRWIQVRNRDTRGLRDLQIAELRANAANWAFGAAVRASGPIEAALPKESLTDGDPATFSRNLNPDPAFAYLIRMTQAVAFTRIELFNRNDGCCPERLSNYRVSLHSDNAGNPGAPNWSAEVRVDNSNSGPGGVDVITPDLDPGGLFEGQWIQVQNLDSGAARYLQVAEVRAFGFGGSSGYRSLIRRDITAEMKGVNSSAWLRVPFNASNTASFDRATLRIKYDDGFVAYLNGTEIARANTPAGRPAYNATATASHFSPAAQEFAVPPAIIHDGANILAVHGLNTLANDRDFLLAPELIAHTSRSGPYGFLLTPTPGSINNSNNVAGFVDDPRVSVQRGFFDAPMDIVITSPTPGATLVYTTNSATPTPTIGVALAPADANSSVTTTVRVATTTVLRTAAFKTGLQPSKVDTHTYLFLSNVVRQPKNPPGFPADWNGTAADYAMDPRVVTNAAYAGEIVNDLRSIPTLSIVTAPGDLFGSPSGIYTFSENTGVAWERAASAEWIQPNGSTAFQVNCGLRIWGTGWRPHSASLKHALQLKFKSEYGSSMLNYPLFSDTFVNRFDNLVLRAQGSRSWNDFRQPDIEQTQYIHDAWARDTCRDMGRTDGHATFVHLYLNGLYWGLYNPVEKTDETFSAEHFGGAKEDYDVLNRRGDVTAEVGDLTAWNQMMTIVNAGLSTPEQYALLLQYLDVDDFIDYMMLNQYATNHDGPNATIANNMRATRRRAPGGLFRFFVWDMEYTFWYPREHNLNFDLDQSPARIFQKLRANPEFRLRFADHAQRHLFNNGALTPAVAAARWQARANEIYGAVVGESARWGDVRRPAQPYTRNVEWTAELNRLLNDYFPVRTGVYLDQLSAGGLFPKASAPSFSQQGGDIIPGFNLAIDAPRGVVYFTTNGLDPRLPGGAASPSATRYAPSTWLVATGDLARVYVPSNNALGGRWRGDGPLFDDSAWAQSSSGAGFDTTPPAADFTIPLQNATADFSEIGRGVDMAIDSNPVATGWGIFEQQDYLPKGRGSVAVFETATNIGFAEGTRLTFTLRHGVAGQLALGKFRLSVTADDRSDFANGAINHGDTLARWTPLSPLSASATGKSTMTLNPDNSILVGGLNPSTNVYVVTAITPMTGITGFRLEAIDDPSLPSNGPGRSGNGDAVLTDFSVQAAPATLTHLIDPVLGAQIAGAMQNQNASAYIRIPFTVAPGSVFQRLALHVRYLDGFSAWLNGRELTARNAPAQPAWNSTATANRAKGRALEFEWIDVSDSLTNLVPGLNILSFQALNDTTTSPDLLLQAELVAHTDLPIALQDTTTVKARVFVDNEWSAVNEATFTASAPLRLTEIMYHPPGEIGVNGDEYQFLEIKNVSAVPFNLSGLSFTSGIKFSFPNNAFLAPGRFFVLAANPARFAQRYPGVTVNGAFGGKLSHHGETLTLTRALGGDLLSVTYGDSAPWPATADGLGFSLVPINPAAHQDPDDAARWRASAQALGSPGAEDPDPGIPAILVNEALSASAPPQRDSIELYNPGDAEADIGGWFLTDDRSAPMKFRVPDHTKIAAHGYRVFDERDFNATPAATNSFLLNAAGEAAYLFSAGASTNLTGYSHGFSFGAAAEGVSFGRHIISTGEERFPAQNDLTLGGPNTGPRVGPVVITEIMYHPPPGGDEFIELKNITAAPVALFDPAHPTNPWRLSGISYTFPPNVTVAPGAFLLVVPSDPAVFRAQYGVPSSIPIFGPYSGHLQDGGEKFSLQRPGAPDSNGVPYITVDEARYKEKSPWPRLAGGFGPSLQRINPALYGDDPANWAAAAPSLATDFAGGVAPVITVQPLDQTRARHETALLSVGASGSPPLRHQWLLQGVDIPNATNAILTLTNLDPAQAGLYQATVFNSAGSTTSAVARLAVLNPPDIFAQPQSRVVSLGASFSFLVMANGNGPLNYQWRYNGADVPGATDSALALTNAQEEQSGEYTVLVTDAVGAVVSDTASLRVVIKPAITLPQQNVIAVEGGVVSLYAWASGSLPLTYRWKRGVVTLTNSILNSHTATLTLSNVQISQAGAYSVTVTNLLPSSSVTTNLTLTVLADGDGDGVPDVWESQFGFNLKDSSDGAADADHDGMSNLAEYIAGTDPTNALSYLKIDAIEVGLATKLSFSAVSNKTYTVQYRDRLDPGPWIKLADVPAGATTHTETVMDPAPATRRYYRLVVPLQP